VVHASTLARVKSPAQLNVISSGIREHGYMEHPAHERDVGVMNTAAAEG
jgi:hypothetical protein